MVGELIICLVLLLFCFICLGNLLFGMSGMMEYDPMGPSAWPIILLVLLILLLGIQMAVLLKKNRGAAVADTKVLSVNRKDALKLACAAGILVVYIVLLDKIGFLPSTPLFMLSYMGLLGQKNRKIKIVVALAATCILYILFSRILQVPLPRGYGIFRDFALSLEIL